MQDKSSRNKKAAKLLGLDTSKVIRNKKITVQQKGYLELKENNDSLLGTWKKRYCVVKDSFFLWYNQKSDSTFSTKPIGVFPLNGAYVDVDKDYNNIIVIDHKKILGGSYFLRADEVQAQEWLMALRKGGDATYEQAKQNTNEIEVLEQKGVEMEQRQLEAIGQLKQKKENLEKAKKARDKVKDSHQNQKKKFAEELEREKEELERKKKQEEQIKRRMKDNEKQKKVAEAKRKELEAKLDVANVTLRRLEESLRAYFEFDTLEELEKQQSARDTLFQFNSSSSLAPGRLKAHLKKNNSGKKVDLQERKSSKFDYRASKAFATAKKESRLPTAQEELELRNSFKRNKAKSQKSTFPSFEDVQLQSEERRLQQERLRRQRQTVQSNVQTIKLFLDNREQFGRMGSRDTLEDF
eukprot:augustus_masked-scaffold_2-processed-gene-2.28-mRNA-1 protein AED:1.00 eAED:1.00 QI:0/-1/0/0/-1/1/1/0/409